MEPDDLTAVMPLEQELQTSACRSNPHRLREILAEGFEEIGASGRVWNSRALCNFSRQRAFDFR